MWRFLKQLWNDKRTQILLPFLILIFVILLPYYQVLFFNRTITAGGITDGVTGTVASENFQNVSDDQIKHMIDRGGSAWQDEPLTVGVSEAYWSGQVPKWNANAGFGKPLGADMMSVAFSALRIPVYLNTSVVIFDFTLLFRLVVGGVLMYLFLRNRALSRIASGAGSVSFILSGYFFYYVNMGHLNVEVLMPGLFLAIDRVIERKKLRDFLGLVLVVTLMITGGHPESMIIICLFASAYFVYRLFETIRKKEPKRRFLSMDRIKKYALPPVVLYTVAFVAAVGITGLLMIPFFEYYLQGHIGVHDPKHQLFNVVLHPAILALQFFPEYIRNAVDTHIYNTFSVTALFLIPVALWNSKYRSLAVFFMGALLVFVAKVYGFLWFGWLEHIPILHNFVYYKYLQSETSFAIAVLVAIGIHAAQVKEFRVPAFFVGILLVIGTLVYLLANTEGIALTQRPYILQAYSVLIAVVLPGVWIYGIVKERFRWKYFPSVGVLLAIILVLEVLAAAPKARPPRIDPYTQTPYLTYLQQQEKPFRVFSPDGILYPATSTVFDIDDIRDVHAVVPELYWNYIHTFIDPTIVDRFSDVNDQTKYRDNPFFDLTNTKYIISKNPLELLPETHLISQIDTENPDNPSLAQAWFTIDRTTRPVLFAHPPVSASYTVVPDANTAFFTGFAGISPFVWKPDYGDGVRFRISLTANGTTTEVFNEYLDPKSNVSDQVWKPFSIPLSQYAGQPVTLALTTETNESESYDWAGWGDIGFTPSAMASSFLETDTDSQFVLEFADDFFVYRNKDAFERAFVVPTALYADDEDTAKASMQQPEFDPRKEAVLVGESETRECTPATASSANVVEQTNTYVKVKVETNGCGVLVVTDLFYPGWTVSVNGQKERLYQANYAFRGVLVSQGESEVIFRYVSPAYMLGAIVSVVSLAGLLYGVWYYRKQKNRA